MKQTIIIIFAVIALGSILIGSVELFSDTNDIIREDSWQSPGN